MSLQAEGCGGRWPCLAWSEASAALEGERCSYKTGGQTDGDTPPDPPDWCVRKAGHAGEHRMFSAARHP